MQNVGAVRTLLHRGIDPDARRSRLVHNTIGGANVLEDSLPILLAAPCSNAMIAEDLVYFLTKAGADLNDDVLAKMCRLADFQGSDHMLWVLAEAGLNAALGGFNEIVDYLIDTGADVKAPPVKKGGVILLEAAAGPYCCLGEFQDEELGQEMKD